VNDLLIGFVTISVLALIAVVFGRLAEWLSNRVKTANEQCEEQPDEPVDSGWGFGTEEK
jgi:hypothetical protein